MGELAKVADATPLRFDFNVVGLKPPYKEGLDAYAKLLTDPRCASEKVEIDGHADIMGPASYNQMLSDQRAEQIAKGLAARGVDQSRVSMKGMSETVPVDPEKSIPARKKNRRVEIRIVK